MPWELKTNDSPPSLSTMQALGFVFGHVGLFAKHEFIYMYTRLMEERRYKLRRSFLCTDIYDLFRLLTNKACFYASRKNNHDRTTLEMLDKFIYECVDQTLQLLGWPLPAMHHKERLSKAFAELAANQGRFPFTKEKTTHCPVCGTQLVTAYDEPLVCEHCLQPVLDALDDLVRATTTEWKPEDLRESYQQSLIRIPKNPGKQTR